MSNGTPKHSANSFVFSGPLLVGEGRAFVFD